MSYLMADNLTGIDTRPELAICLHERLTAWTGLEWPRYE